MREHPSGRDENPSNGGFSASRATRRMVDVIVRRLCRRLGFGWRVAQAVLQRGELVFAITGSQNAVVAYFLEPRRETMLQKSADKLQWIQRDNRGGSLPAIVFAAEGYF